MPNNAKKGMFENRKISELWKPPAWLEPAFIYIAFTVAAVASVTLLFWILVTFVVPFNLYSKETEEIALINGQTLQVKYPNLVLAGDTPTNITLILFGESNATDPTTFTVVVPPGLTVVEPAGQAQSKNVELTAPDLGSATTPTQMVIEVVNSHSVNGALLFERHPVEINSSSMSFPQRIGVGVEHILWISMRGIVNNAINERSTLIVLITGFLSGAGALVLQNLKTHRDRLWDERKKSEERFSKLMQEDYESAVDVFLRVYAGEYSRDDPDYLIYTNLMEQSNWYNRLPVIALTKLQNRETSKARQIAKYLVDFCILFGEKYSEDTFLFQSLHATCDLALTMNRKQKKDLVEVDVNNLLVASRHWQEDLSSTAQDLIQYFASFSAQNLLLLKTILEKDKFGNDLLKSSNLQHVILFPVENLNKDELQELIEIAHSLNWRPLWPRSEQGVSEKIQRWLTRHGGY